MIGAKRGAAEDVLRPPLRTYAGWLTADQSRIPWQKSFLEVTPARQGGEARKVAVGSYAFTGAFDGESGVDRVGNDLASQIAIFAEFAKNAPMIYSRTNHSAAWTCNKSIDKPESLLAVEGGSKICGLVAIRRRS